MPLEVGPTAPYARLHKLPIVEPGPLELPLVERKPQRLDEVKLRSGGETGPSGIAGVPVDFWLNQNDVERAHGPILATSG